MACRPRAGHRAERVSADAVPGQESVWDYPRPPIVVPSDRHVVVEHAGVVLAETRRAVRVLETASPPAWYLPPEHVRTELLARIPGAATVCEWKGRATYLGLVMDGLRTGPVAWTYDAPTMHYVELAGWLAFFGGRVDRITVTTNGYGHSRVAITAAG